jgi:hypothetical protein
MKNKKLFIAMAFLASTFIFFSSCKKNEKPINNIVKNNIPISANSYNLSLISNESDYLCFSDVDAFLSTCESLDQLNDSLLDVFESNFSNFSSFRKFHVDFEDLQYDQDIDINPCDDDALGTVINIDGIVKVDTVAFLLDFANHEIYEVYPVNAATIAQLKLKTEYDDDTMYIFKYSMDDEVFYPTGVDYEESVRRPDQKISNNNKRGFKWLKKLFGKCKDEKQAKIRNDDDESSYTFGTTQYKYIYKLKYQGAGIRFSIIYKIKHFKKEGESGGWKKSKGKACFEARARTKVFCGNYINEDKICYLPSTLPLSSYSNLNVTKYKNTIYKSGNRLSKYKCKGSFLMENMATYDLFFSRELLIESNPESNWVF